MLNHSFNEETFPNIQPESPLAQPEAISSSPIAYLEGKSEKQEVQLKT